MKPERPSHGLQDEADKLALAWVGKMAFRLFHKGLGVEIAKLANTGPAGVADDHMVKDFNFQKLPGSD